MSLAPWKVRALLGAVFVLVLSSVPAFGQTTIPPGGGTGANNPPVLLSLAAEQVTGQRYRIYGRVADETPASCGVIITGAANGVALCDAEGYFNAIYSVGAPGVIYAVVGDGQLSSGASMLTLLNAPPTVGGFIAVQGAGNTWTFSGTVGDEAPDGLTVTLSGPAGVNGASTTVQANGTWSITLTLAPGSGGNVTATVTDWYALTGAAYTTF